MSVCLSATLPLVPLAKTDRTDRDVAWSVYLSKPKEADITWGPDPPWEAGTLRSKPEEAGIRWGPDPPWEAGTLREGTWACPSLTSVDILKTLIAKEVAMRPFATVNVTTCCPSF